MLSEFNRLIRKSYTVQIMEFDEEVTLASVGAGVKAGQKRQIQNDDTFLMPSRPSPQQRTEQDIRMPVLQPFVDNGHVEEDDDDADEDGDPISPQVKRVKVRSQQKLRISKFGWKMISHFKQCHFNLLIFSCTIISKLKANDKALVHQLLLVFGESHRHQLLLHQRLLRQTKEKAPDPKLKHSKKNFTVLSKMTFQMRR